MKLYSKIIGEGKPLFILHGFLGMGDNWKTLGKQFADEGFQVHLIDQRNHGRSPHTDEFNYELMAEDIKDYQKEHNIDKASVIGHSMGGKTAMKFAVNYPNSVEKLIVVDIAPKYYAPHHQAILEGLTALHRSNLDSREDADDILKNFVKEVGVRQFLLKNLYRKDKDTLALRMNISVLEEKVEHVGQAINDNEIYNGNALFVNGDQSDYIRESDTETIKKHFPKSKLVTIKGAGHWIHAEKPKDFYETVLQYLQS
ncbi:alpha/beta fold hydrolase [Mesonia sp. K7]|uniref:alpha/beta fold hydrolase n=1 Tax=Mesonia sp. K7 TaxID=2218606 RepID=UPI000DA73B82|nr:alpha/beta fold hydrolase [Mesonia sp. K7]PZD78732.1 alpha/beta hydrolase [Mesonia sp. K7]